MTYISGSSTALTGRSKETASRSCCSTARFSASLPELHGSRSVTYLTPSLRGQPRRSRPPHPRRGRPRPHAQPRTRIPQRAAAAPGAATVPSAATRDAYATGKRLESRGRALPRPSQARRDTEPQRPSRRVLAEAGTRRRSCGGAEGGAATSGEPPSFRGAGSHPEVRPTHNTHAHTHALGTGRTRVSGARARGQSARRG